MKLLKLILPICLLFLFNTLQAQINGCTDPLATNYNPSATTNDGSCMYNSASVSPTSGFELAGSLSETSGLIRWNNQIWTHNDSEDINLYALDTLDGSIMQQYPVTGSTNIDWEEISQDSNFVYIGDFGNNANGNRTDLKVLRILKSSVLSGSPVTAVINFAYSNQTNFTPAGANNTDFDCEAFVVSSDSIYLFTKQWISNQSSVYSMPKTPGTYTANLKSTFNVQGLISGATYLESKNLVVLSGYTALLQPFTFLLYDFHNFDFFSGNKRKISISLPFHQVEGIATSDGLKYYISNEYFSFPPAILVPQKLHTLDLSPYLSGYLSNLYNASAFSEKKEISVYPNPARDIITVETSGLHLPDNYRLINQSGQTVKSGTLTVGNSTIRISEIPAGNYILVTGKGKRNSMIVIKK